jgi:hypothetical protein
VLVFAVFLGIGRADMTVLFLKLVPKNCEIPFLKQDSSGVKQYHENQQT